MQDPLNFGKMQFSGLRRNKTHERVSGHLQVNDSDRHGEAETLGSGSRSPLSLRTLKP